MWWFIPLLLKGAAVYTAGKAAKTVIDYATTDQEKEGRELGTEVAAAIYGPVFKNFKAKQKKINAETDKEYFDAKSQVKLLKEQCAYYERETANYKSKIETIKREHGDSPGVKAVLSALAASGGATIGTGAMLGVNSVRAFGSSVASAGFAWLALPAAVLTYILESEMSEKRERFFKEEFEKKALVWKKKIESVRAEILASIKNLRAFKADKTEELNRLTKLVDDAMKEYFGARADYNALNMAVKKNE